MTALDAAQTIYRIHKDHTGGLSVESVCLVAFGRNRNRGHIEAASSS